MNVCHLLPENSTFKDVVKALSQPGIHRVAMTGKTRLFGGKSNRLVRFLTQSDLLHFISANLKDFAVDVSVGNRLGSQPVYCVSSTAKTIDAFREVINRKVSALGVLDNNGILVGNVSIRDLAHVARYTPSTDLQLPLGEFINQLKKKNLVLPRELIACLETDTVRTVIQQLDSNHIHRIYVVDANNKPLRVISLGDIFTFLLKSLKSKSL